MKRVSLFIVFMYVRKFIIAGMSPKLYFKFRFSTNIIEIRRMIKRYKLIRYNSYMMHLLLTLTIS